MILSSGTKEHHGRLTSTDMVHPLHHLAQTEHCIVLSYEIMMFACNSNYTSLVITNTTYTIPSMGTVLALLLGLRHQLVYKDSQVYLSIPSCAKYTKLH